LASVEQGIVNGYAIEFREYTPVCMSPCDQVIDGSHGEMFVAGGDFPGRKAFRFVGMQGDVDLQVKPGSKGLRALAITLDILGGAAVITGATFLIVGLSNVTATPVYDNYGNQTGTTNSSSNLTPVGAGFLVGGGVALVAGIVLGLKSRTQWDLHPQAAVVGERKARFWAGEF
jgi:hypothetical protein